MQSAESRLQRLQVQSRLEGKVIASRCQFQQFQLDIAAQGGKQVIGLSRHRLRGRLLREWRVSWIREIMRAWKRNDVPIVSVVISR